MVIIMSNKVYIVLEYKESPDLWGITTCRVQDVYCSRKRAEKRKRYLERLTKE